MDGGWRTRAIGGLLARLARVLGPWRGRGRGAKGETGSCSRRDPWPAPAIAVGLRSAGGWGVGVEKMTLWTGWLMCGAHVAAAVSEAGRVRGRCAGLLVAGLLGLRELVRRPAASRWRG